MEEKTPEVAMPVITYPFGAFEANCHIVHNGVDAVVIDPSTDVARVMGKIAEKGLALRAVLLTHLHPDHCIGCADMARATGLKPLVGREDWEHRALLLGDAMCMGMFKVAAFEAEMLAPGEVEWGSLKCRVIHAPGHSAGSLCYYFPDLSVLASGDVLFFRSVGRTDFVDGDHDTLMRSIREKLYTLPGDTMVYPGHGPETSIGFEAVRNSFCRA